MHHRCTMFGHEQNVRLDGLLEVASPDKSFHEKRGNRKSASQSAWPPPPSTSSRGCSPEPDRRYLFRFSFTRNFTILVTSVSGSGLSFGNCTAPLDHLYGPNCFLKAAIPEDVG